MSQQHIRRLSKEFEPALVGTPETKALFSVAKGERVLWASAQVVRSAAAATDTSMTLGDNPTDPDGYIAAIDLEANVAGTVIAGAGAYLAASGGKLYNVADTVDAVYAGTVFGAIKPKVLFTVAIVREYPS